MSRKIHAGGRVYDADEFVCEWCRTKLVLDTYYTIDGKNVCQSCRNKERCTSCGFLITETKYVTLDDKTYHPDCFRCSECLVELTGKFFFEDNALFCDECIELREPSNPEDCCSKCFLPLSGGIIKALGNRYHEDCFVCHCCFKDFPNDEFVNVKGNPFCDDCIDNESYLRSTAHLKATGQDSAPSPSSGVGGYSASSSGNGDNLRSGTAGGYNDTSSKNTSGGYGDNSQSGPGNNSGYGGNSSGYGNDASRGTGGPGGNSSGYGDSSRGGPGGGSPSSGITPLYSGSNDSAGPGGYGNNASQGPTGPLGDGAANRGPGGNSSGYGNNSSNASAPGSRGGFGKNEPEPRSTPDDEFEIEEVNAFLNPSGLPPRGQSKFDQKPGKFKYGGGMKEEKRQRDFKSKAALGFASESEHLKDMETLGYKTLRRK